MLRATRADAAFRASLVALLFATFLLSGPFVALAEARLCNESCSAQPLTGCGVTCGWIDQFVYTVWNWSCYGFCDVWMCAYVHQGVYSQQCDTICSRQYNDYCWVYLE